MVAEPRGDGELMAAIQGRDVSALEAFYDRHRVLAYSLAMRVLGSQNEAEDVVQEAFLNLWRAADTYRSDRSSARSWLLSIVHNRSIDKLRGRRTRVQAAALEAAMDIPDRTDVWREVSQALTGQDVRRALAQLPPEQREAIELAYFQGRTHTEIAELTEVPLGTVKGRMRLGLHKLRSLLETSQTGMALE
ncbi:MAG TPA: sigma-70 family RNA polymerase sigma factor [Chloroflexota bacterium]|nr:sigma-70 family RNA polymerase sigma factor [Chloroflexota bacterium]